MHEDTDYLEDLAKAQAEIAALKAAVVEWFVSEPGSPEEAKAAEKMCFLAGIPE